MGIWTTIQYMIPWAHPSPQPKRHLDRFSRIRTKCRYTLQWDAPFPLKIAPSRGRSGPPTNTLFLGPTTVLNPNSMSIGAAVLQGSLV